MTNDKPSNEQVVEPINPPSYLKLLQDYLDGATAASYSGTDTTINQTKTIDSEGRSFALADDGSGPASYAVAGGDTVDSISESFLIASGNAHPTDQQIHDESTAIAASSHLADVNQIFPNETLLIPTSGTDGSADGTTDSQKQTPISTQESFDHYVGQSLWSATAETDANGLNVPNAEQTQLIKQALQIAGMDQTQFNVDAVDTIIVHESSWNPNAENDWDINAQNGDPSRGLMQTINSTFETYRNRSLPNAIFNPLSNIVAGLNYVKLATYSNGQLKYGSLANVRGIQNLENGGSYVGY